MQDFEREVLGQWGGSKSASYNESTPFILAIFGNYVNFVIFLILVYFALRAFRAYSVYKRSKGNKSIWLQGNAIDAQTLFDAIKTNIEAKNFTGITFGYETLQDKYVLGSSHKYMKVTFRGTSWYISAFPISDDYIISYWRVAENNIRIGLINAIPVYGPVIADIITTPTLYTADINGATTSMINGEIQSAIDELTQDIPDKRETSQDFKTIVNEMSKGK